MKLYRSLAAAALAALCLIVYTPILQAQSIPANVVAYDISTTVGAVSAPCVPPNNARLTLFIWNDSSNTIGYATGQTAIGTGSNVTAALNAAGTITIAPNTGYFWPYGTAPQNGLNCIASGTNSAMTVIEGRIR